MAKEEKSTNERKERMVKHRALIKKRKPNFLRHKWFSLPSLGRGIKKNQKWRKPKGRHSKLREKKKGQGRQPSIGFRSPRMVRSTLNGLKPLIVRNLNDLEKADKLVKQDRNKEFTAFLASVGMKKKIEIAKKAVQLDIGFANFSPKSFLKEAEKELESRKKDRKIQEEKAKQRTEKAKKTKEKKETETAKQADAGVPAKQETKEEKEIIKPKAPFPKAQPK